MIAPEAGLSISRQCTLLGLARSSFYYRPRPEPAEELALLKRLDRIFTDCPVYGSRRLQVALLREGISMGRPARPAADALARFGKPDIFNTDQGAQFTSDEFTNMLRDRRIEISMEELP